MTSPGTPPLADEASLAAAARLFARHRAILLAVPLCLGALTVVWTALRPRAWSSRASILPQRTDMARSGIGALATQFGLNLNLNEAGQAPGFYAELLRTPQLLSQVAETPVRITRPKPDSGTVMQLLRISAPDSALARARAVQALRNMMLIRVDDQLGLVRLTVRSYSPELSQQVATRMIELVNEFNVVRRQSRATAERHFAEERRQLAAEEMAAAEARLMRFLESNRNYSGSPTLQATRDRLQRELSLKSQIYSTLTQAYEQARIDEVRDTPVITVVEAPEVSARPDSRRLVIRLAVALLVGLVLALAVALFLEFDGPARLAYLRRGIATRE